MLPPIVGNVEWVVTKVSSVSSVGVGIFLLNAAVNYSENLIFDNIDPTTHISDVGEKTYMTLVDNAKMAQIAMQQFGCFFLDKKTMKDATKKLTDVFDITFGTAYVHLSTLAKYLFGEDYDNNNKYRNINTKTNQSKMQYEDDDENDIILTSINVDINVNDNNNNNDTNRSNNDALDISITKNKDDENKPENETSLKLIKNIAYISLSALTLGAATVAFLPLFSLQCLCNPRLAFLGSVRAATFTLFILTHPIHTKSLIAYYVYETSQTSKLDDDINHAIRQTKIKSINNGQLSGPDTPASSSSIIVIDKPKSIIKVRVVKANNLRTTKGFFGYWKENRSPYVEVYLTSVDEETKEQFVQKIGKTSTRNSTVNPSWEHSDEVIEFEVLNDDIKTVVEKIKFKIFSESAQPGVGVKHLGDAETDVPSPINEETQQFLQNPNTTPIKQRSISSNSNDVDEGFVLSDDEGKTEQIVQTNITMPKVDSLEKIPLFVTRLDTRVLTIIDPQMPDGNIDIGTITVNIGHFIVDETL